MFTKTITAIYENGVFRPLAPIDLEDGQIVHVPVVQSFSEQERQESIRELRAQIAEWLKHPELDSEEEEEWEAFHAFLQENRLNFPERDLRLGDE